MLIWQVILIVIVIVAICLGVGFVWQLNLGRRREQVMRQRFPQARALIPRANFFGQESKGRFQIRGNGTFVVTDHEVYFEKYFPRREYHIPLASVQNIETPRGFLGKTLGTNPLLQVNYRAESGQKDAMAWFFPDVTAIKQLLER